MLENIRNLIHSDKSQKDLSKLGIYRCNKCKTWGEAVQGVAACSQCSTAVNVYPPLQIVNQLSSRYFAALREIESLKSQLNEEENTEDKIAAPASVTTLNLHETDQLATEAQHQPLAKWFAKQQIKAQFDYSAVDMSGFYDEAAEKIGSNYAVFEKLLGQLNWAYRKNVLNLNFDLKKYSQKEQQIINNICREFYSHTLFSVYNYKKQDKNLFLKLQPAAPIRQFFSGGWLEWFALNIVLQQVQEKNIRFSVARSVKIRFANHDLQELDVVLFTPNHSPIIIECKSGEYRKDLDKYLKLRKRLHIPAQNYILLVLDVDDTQAKSMSSMYDLTFVTLNTLAEHLKRAI